MRQISLTGLFVILFLALLANQIAALEIIGNVVQIRSAPSLKAQVVGKAKRGENFEVLEVGEEWVKIKFKGNEAWVYKGLTSLGKQQTKESALQKERRQFIEELIRKGIFKKVVVPGKLPHLWVAPGFYLFDFEEKGKLVGVVYAYYNTIDPEKYPLVVIYDSMIGKEIGKFAPLYGGLKLY